MPIMQKVFVLCALVLASSFALGQERAATPPEDAAQQRIRALEERLSTLEDSVRKDIGDLMIFQRLGDLALVDKVSYTSAPPRVIPNPTGQGATNPVIIRAYT